MNSTLKVKNFCALPRIQQDYDTNDKTRLCRYGDGGLNFNLDSYKVVSLNTNCTIFQCWRRQSLHLGSAHIIGSRLTSKSSERV